MARAHGWPFLRLDGSCSVKARQALVNSFNDPSHPSFLLLLSSKAGGVGLNIIGANRLFLFDPGARRACFEANLLSARACFLLLLRRRRRRRSLARSLARPRARSAAAVRIASTRSPL